VCDGLEPMPLGDHVADPLMQLAGRLLDVPFEQRDGHRLFAREVLVEGANRDAGALGNPVRGPAAYPWASKN
jgi:hypothetical protein